MSLFPLFSQQKFGEMQLSSNEFCQGKVAYAFAYGWKNFSINGFLAWATRINATENFLFNKLYGQI